MSKDRATVVVYNSICSMLLECVVKLQRCIGTSKSKPVPQSQTQYLRVKTNKSE